MIIKDQAALNAFAVSLQLHPFITVDTEFLREKTYYPKLCLIQIGTPDNDAAAIDPLVDDLDLSPIFDVLMDKKILKVFHAARQDLEIFYDLMGHVVTPFFDTQIAAMVCGHGDSIGYENIVRKIKGIQIDKSTQYTNWSNRPLSEKQIKYALGDVTHLIDVYKNLVSDLQKRERSSWVAEEKETLASPDLYENDPFKIWKKIKIRTPKSQSLALLRELAAWREKRAQSKNIPRSWVLRDETLADMASQAPVTRETLSKIRNMPKGLVESRHGATLIQLVEDTLKSDPSTWPKPDKRKKSLTPDIAAKIDVLKLLLKVQAAHHGVAAKLIASKTEIEQLATEDEPDINPLKGWRYTIFGKDALELKQGKIAIGLNNGKIIKHRL